MEEQESSSKIFSIPQTLPKLKLNINFSNSWLESPAPKQAGDTVGSWDLKENIPPGNAVGHFIKKARKSMPQTPLVSYESEDLEKFLEGENLLSSVSNQLELPNDAFSPASFDLPVKAPRYHTIDSLCRKSLKCLFISECLATNAWDHIKSTLKDNVDQDTLDDLSNFFPLMLSSMVRGRSLLEAIFAHNKFAFRKFVLDSYVGNIYTKNILFASGLATPYLFGPVPESLQKKLDQSLINFNSNSFILKRRTGPTYFGNANKAKGSLGSRGRGKAQKPSFYKEGSNVGNKPFSPQTSSAAPQAAERFSAGRGRGRGQGFRGRASKKAKS